MSDLVSIIIPTYNRAHLIKKTLKSVQSQTHTNWECIVVDDGSTDTTIEVIMAIAKEDTRIRLLTRPDDKPKGANACRNIGFEASTGAYINFLDSDDILLPNKLDLQLEALLGSDYPFSICQTNVWDEHLQEDLGLRCESIHSLKPLDDYIQFKIFWSIQAPLWKRETIESIRFNESLQQSQEYDFHIRVLADYTNYHTTEEVLTTIISHSTNMSRSRTDRMDKFISNLDVRYSTLKRFKNILQPETKTYLFAYFILFYKRMVIERDFRKAYACLQRIIKAIHYLDDYNGQKFKYLIRWNLAIPSFFLFGKGEVFLKRIE